MSFEWSLAEMQTAHIRDKLVEERLELIKQTSEGNALSEKAWTISNARGAKELGITTGLEMEALMVADRIAHTNGKEALKNIAESPFVNKNISDAARARYIGYDGQFYSQESLDMWGDPEAAETTAHEMMRLAEQIFIEEAKRRIGISIRLYQETGDRLVIDLPEASLEEKLAAGLDAETDAIVLKHVAKGKDIDSISRLGHIGVSYRGTFTTPANSANNLQIRLPDGVEITVCIPRDKVRRDPECYGFWVDMEPEPELTDIVTKFRERPILYNPYTAKPLLKTMEVPELYPTHIPPKYIISTKQLVAAKYEAKNPLSKEEVTARLLDGVTDEMLSDFSNCIRQNASTKEFIEAIQVAPSLAEVYKSQVGTWEAYSLRQHTGMAMKQFDKYFADNFDQTFVTIGEFKAMFILHDIGKPISIEQTGTKGKAHPYTYEITRQLLVRTGLEQDKANLLANIASQDLLGPIINDPNAQVEDVVNYIRIVSKQYNMPECALLKIMETYQLCDGSSYTTDANGLYSFDKSFIFDRENNAVRFNDEIDARIQKVRDQLTS